MKRVLLACGSLEHCPPKYCVPYEDSLRAAGMEPVMVRPGETAPDDMPGLLLIGGSDVNPALYESTRHGLTEGSDDARDHMESRLIREALARDTPILGICRGLQMLNVQHGGTLIQHLHTTERHRVKTPDRGHPVHRVEIKPGTKLAGIVGGAKFLDVNSRHHQAIDRLGRGLIVSAVDPEDGVVEAVERPDRSFVVAVQWHPENQSARDPLQAALFEAFAAALDVVARA